MHNKLRSLDDYPNKKVLDNLVERLAGIPCEHSLLVNIVRRLWICLSKEQRKILSLRCRKIPMSHDKIGRKLSMKPGTVKSIEFRTVDRLYSWALFIAGRKDAAKILNHTFVWEKLHPTTCAIVLKEGILTLKELFYNRKRLRRTNQIGPVHRTEIFGVFSKKAHDEKHRSLP